MRAGNPEGIAVGLDRVREVEMEVEVEDEATACC